MGPVLACHQKVKGENPKAKNVEILEEAVRVVFALGGGCCVFCKSGKDRTAMAVTLHQAKVRMFTVKLRQAKVRMFTVMMRQAKAQACVCRPRLHMGGLSRCTAHLCF
jgi:hypothetical protein